MKRVVLCALLLASGAQPGYAEQDMPQHARIPTVKFTDRGIESAPVRIAPSDGFVFFLNDTSDSLTTVEVNFGTKGTHCATENMRIDPNGIIRSIRPFGPKGFASVCLHDRGTYPFKVLGIRGSSQPAESSIIIE